MERNLKKMITRVITAVIAGSLFWSAFILVKPVYFSAILLGILATVVIFEWTRFFAITKPLFWLLLPVYPTLPFVLLIMLNQSPVYHNLLMILFMIVFSFDTGSYIIGVLVGKHKLAPRISPGKTWEGLVGGYFFSVGGLKLACLELGIEKSLLVMIGFALLVSTLSLFGDLFESWLKRLAHIKDSGDFLPGHGGFLDRFDGILFAVFFFYYFKDYLVMFFNL